MGEKGTMTRRHILDSACPLFIRHGYKAVTMQDICRASGLSKGGLYRHYKDKSSLFSDLLQSFQEDRRLHPVSYTHLFQRTGRLAVRQLFYRTGGNGSDRKPSC